MKKAILFFFLVLSLPLAAQAQAQKQPFDPSYFSQNLRFDAGVYVATGTGSADAGMTQLTYTKAFWGPLAWRAGVLTAGDGLGFDGYAGMPLSLSYCPGTVSFGERLIYAAEASIFDVIMDAITGNTDRIGEDILANFIMVLFRRTEFYAGLTPGFYYGPRALDNPDGNRFSLTADAGVVLSIPIRRLSIDITPAYHYSITKNVWTDIGGLHRHFFSVSAGLSWLF